MKSNRTLIATLIATAVTIIVVVVFLYIKSYTPKFRWFENYAYTNDHPYGLKLLYDIFSGNYKKDAFVLINELPKNKLNKKDTSSLYISIGQQFNTDSINSIALLEFVKRGNIVFVSASRGEHDLFSIISDNEYPLIEYYTYNDSIVNVSLLNTFNDSVFTFHYKYYKSLKQFDWHGVDSTIFADSLSLYNYEQVSAINEGYIDCFRVKYGKGWLIYHLNPIYFSNYHFSEEYGLKYLNALFQPYKINKIYWDEYSKSYNSGTDDNSTKESVFRFIFSEKSLKWSWFLLLGFTLLFLILNTKRSRPIIPLVPGNKNTTLEYIETIAAINYQSNNIILMADEMMKQFLSFVKQKYNVSTNMDKPLLAKKVAPKSGIPVVKIDEIFKYYREIKYNQVPENKSLIELYKTIEYFYKNCK